MRRLTTFAAVSALLLSACAGPSVLLAGESMRLPEPPPLMLSFVVLGADDGSNVEVREGLAEGDVLVLPEKGR